MPRFISAEKARRIAYAWHDGAFSALYAFAATGLIKDLNVLIRNVENQAQLAETKTAKRELSSLKRFCQSSIIGRIPGKYPYAAPWARAYS